MLVSKIKEDGILKFDLIMNQLIKVKKENPNYKVYITRHRYVVFYTK
jgi:hypothetical protein